MRTQSVRSTLPPALVNPLDVSLLGSVLDGPADPEIVEHETRMRAAQLSGDVETLEGLIADDLLFTGPDGRLATKSEDLEAHRSGAVRFLSHEPEELRIRRVNRDVAIAALRARLVVAIGENVVRGTFRYTRIWERGPLGSFRVVGGHVSALQSPTAEADTP